jgi:hypothetical protein
MIYFDAETKRQVVAAWSSNWFPAAISSSAIPESLNGLTDRLKPVKPTIYRLPSPETIERSEPISSPLIMDATKSR